MLKRLNQSLANASMRQGDHIAQIADCMAPRSSLTVLSSHENKIGREHWDPSTNDESLLGFQFCWY